MYNPHYLTVSRHNVYYFRFPIPKQFHPHNKATDLKLSLDTRCPDEALQIARSLLYFAENAMKNAVIHTMDYQEIRDTLHHHFKQMRDRVKERIAKHGRLTLPDLTAYQNGHGLAAQTLVDKDYTYFGTPEQLTHFAEANGLTLKPNTQEYETVRTEYVKAYRDYCESVLEYDKRFEGYNFKTSPEALAMQRTMRTTSRKKLKEEIETYVNEKLRLGDWTEKSANSFRSQLNLMLEYLGQDASVHIEPEVAHDVKRMLMQIPKNSRSNPKLMKKSVAELMEMNVADIDRMSKKNIAKYLDTYTAFYDWAIKRKITDENQFKSLKVKVKKKGQVRDAFTFEQISLMLDELKTNKRGLINKDYQKWGSLIGIYTGARLNEIAQLELTDIKQDNGIWCFDLNIEGENKKLKNENSKRLVPIHEDLIALGLLRYVEQMREGGKVRLLHQLSYDKNNGYGRNLSRWFNNEFLKKLGIKTDGLVFHSTRHSMLTYLLQAGVQEPIAKTISGHALSGVVQNVYAKGYKTSQLKEAIDLLYRDLPPVPEAIAS